MAVRQYRVKPGKRHGIGKKYGPGDIVTLTDAEAAGFLDKLELVEYAPTKLEPAPAELGEGTPGEPGDAEAGAEAGAENSEENSPPATDPDHEVTDEAGNVVLAEDAPGLSQLWQTAAPGLNARLVESLVDAGLAPAVVASMDDAALLQVNGVGPTSLRAIREALG